jgi:hypothetical protein
MYLLFIHTSFLNCLFSLFAHLFNGLLIFCGIRFLNSLYSLLINPFSSVYLAKIFPHSVGCAFSLATASFPVQKCYAVLFVNSPNCWALGILFIKLLPICSSAFYILSCRSFTVATFLYFEFILG